MAKIKIVDNGNGTETVTFQCPGCGKKHEFVNGSDGEEKAYFWGPDKPTVKKEVSDGNWNKFCHFIIRSGSIKFFPDCGHAAAGKILPLPDFNEANIKH